MERSGKRKQRQLQRHIKPATRVHLEQASKREPNKFENKLPNRQTEKQKKDNQYHSKQEKNKKLQEHRYTPKCWETEQNGVYQEFFFVFLRKTFERHPERYWYAILSSLTESKAQSGFSPIILETRRALHATYEQGQRAPTEDHEPEYGYRGILATRSKTLTGQHSMERCYQD
eukprot:3389027-Amphidinium_carterae.1